MIESNGALEQADVVVIGAGPAGETVAGRCADGGLDVVPPSSS
jgi:dihydrolipoamide dehydrogenase